MATKFLKVENIMDSAPTVLDVSVGGSFLISADQT